MASIMSQELLLCRVIITMTASKGETVLDEAS